MARLLQQLRSSMKLHQLQQNARYHYITTREKSRCLSYDNVVLPQDVVQRSLSQTGKDVKWLHPAGNITIKYDAAHRHGSLHCPVIISFSTAQPLQQHQVTEALMLASRRMLPLRICLRHRDNQLWLCEKLLPKIDLKVVEGSDILSELGNSNEDTFINSADGPLWRARLLVGSNDLPNPRHKVKPTFSNHYHLLLSFHQGLFDGFTVMVAMRTIFEALDSVRNGSCTNVEQVGELISDEQTLITKLKIREEMEKDPQKIDLLTKQYLNKSFTPLLTQAFGQPAIRQSATRHLVSNLPSSTLLKFTALCKTAGVSPYSGFTAAINTATVEMVKEAGLEMESFTVTGRHAVNLRQYWKTKPATPVPLGCHVDSMVLTFPVPHDAQQKFWEYATQVNHGIKEKKLNKEIFVQRVVKDKARGEDFDYDAYFGAAPPPVTCDYNLSYPFFPHFDIRTSYQLHVSQILPLTFLNKAEFTTTHIISYLGGQMVYTISYSAWYVQEHVAQMLTDKVSSFISKLTEE